MKRAALAMATTIILTAGLAGGALAQDEGVPVTIKNLTVVEEGLGWNETFAEITEMFAETHPGSEYTIEYSPQEQHSQKVQLVAAQGALPFMYTGVELDVIAELDARGEVLDLEPVLEELGVLDKITPAGRAAAKSFFNGRMLALPLQMNIEGVWYNKDIFAELGLQPPATWEEFVAVGNALNDAGVQPLAASGVRAWPITRLISGYIFRSLGPDALIKVENGEASLTDPEYVAAAQAIADLGAAGFFGPGVSDLDYGPAADLFLQGQAGMFYMGSWAVADFHDAERNLIGEDAIGFFPFPAVEGGAGDVTQTPMNLGATTLFNASLYDDAVGEWLKAVVENYGDIALRNQGQVTGFVISEASGDLRPLTKLVTDEIAKTTTSVTWFEQLFTARELDAAWRGVVPLVTGQLSAQDYMQSIVDAG